MTSSTNFETVFPLAFQYLGHPCTERDTKFRESLEKLTIICNNPKLSHVSITAQIVILRLENSFLGSLETFEPQGFKSVNRVFREIGQIFEKLS